MRKTDIPDSPLFESHPAANEVAERSLGQGLVARIPLALYSRDGRTLNPEPVSTLSLLQTELQKISIGNLTAADSPLRYANVIIAWNIFQHFYPYFDVVDTDWDAVLTETLSRSSNNVDETDFLFTLQWMVAQLEDGHGYVQHQLKN